MFEIPGYTIEKQLGQGAYGTVYKARELASGRLVAIKVLAPDMQANATALARFKREIRATLQIEHPNLIQGYTAGQERGYWFYVMEYVEGTTAAREIDRRDGFDEQSAFKIALAAAKGLSYAAGFDLIHRDIKPDNVMLSKTGEVKLCDMGLAKTVDSDNPLTLQGQAVGTPHFMSPEQARCEDLDFRTDVYSLGATLYSLLTAKLPVEGRNPLEAMKNVMSGRPVPIRQHRPELSDTAVRIVERMMARAPDDRYPSYEALIDDLRQVAGAGVTSRRIPKQTPTPRAFRPSHAPSAADVLFARILLKGKLVSAPTLGVNLDTQEQLALVGAPVPLADVLVAAGALSAEDSQRCAASMAAFVADRARNLFVRLGSQAGAIDGGLMARLRQQGAPGSSAPRAELLVAEQRLAPDAHRQLLARVQAQLALEEEQLLHVSAVSNGLLDQDAAARCRKAQAARLQAGDHVPLADLFVTEGKLEPVQRAALLRAVRRNTLTGVDVSALLQEVRA